MTKVSAKVWQTPKAARYGTFAEATAQCMNKTLGGGDGQFFQPGNIPLACVS